MAAKLKYANFLRNQNKLEQAEVLFQDVLKAGLSTEMVTMCLAEIYLAKNRPDKLDATLTPRLKQNPFNGYLWYFRSKQYEMMSRNKSKSEVVDYQDESITALNKAIELLDNAKFQMELAQRLESFGRIDQAEIKFREILVDNPDSIILNFVMAQFLQRHHQEMRSEALTFARKAQSLSAAVAPGEQPIPNEALDALVTRLSR